MTRDGAAPIRPSTSSALACALILMLATVSVAANELTVDRREIRLNDLLTITVILEGPFANVDFVAVSVENLVILGEPSVSSEFAWTNGDVMRRKVFRYRARPVAAGAARVGPLALDGADGQRVTLPAIQVTVTSDPVSTSNDAALVLRRLVSSGREPLFVVAESSAQSVYVGEPIEVTWWLYNAAAVQQWQIAQIPRLDEFWTEERPRSETPERVILDGSILQRLPIRRVVLFPLRSGNLRIPGLTIEGAVMRRARNGPFRMFEGELIETAFTSAAIEVSVKPLPAGPPIDAVGELTLSCAPPVQDEVGPVVISVTLQGRGNLRAARPPAFDGELAGRLQIEGGEVTISAREAEFAMRRQWRYLVFPSAEGPLTIPPLEMTVFNPATGERQDLSCAASLVNARRLASTSPLSDEAPAEAVPPSRARFLPALVIFALAVAAGLLLWPLVRRERRLRRDVRAILGDGRPAAILDRVRERVPFDEREPGERGEALRALRSLLDAAAQGRDVAAGAEREIARRVRDVLRMR